MSLPTMPLTPTKAQSMPSWAMVASAMGPTKAPVRSRKAPPAR